MRSLVGLILLSMLILALLILPWLVPLATSQKQAAGRENLNKAESRPFRRISKCSHWEPGSADQMIQNIVTLNRVGQVAWNSWTAAASDGSATVCIFDTKNPENNTQNVRIQIPSGTKLVQLALDDSGTLLASLTTDGIVTYWDVRNQGQQGQHESVPLCKSEFAVNIAFDDRSKLWIVTARGAVYTHDFDAQTLYPITQIFDSKTLGTKIESFHAVTVISDAAMQKIYVFQNYNLTQTVEGVDFALEPSCQTLCVLEPDRVSLRTWAKHMSPRFDAIDSAPVAPVTLDRHEMVCGILADLGLVTSNGKIYPVFQGRIYPTAMLIDNFPATPAASRSIHISGQDVLVVDRNASNFGALEIFCAQ